eukprot:10896997-Karenia_brevis.AAC.1
MARANNDFPQDEAYAKDLREQVTSIRRSGACPSNSVQSSSSFAGSVVAAPYDVAELDDILSRINTNRCCI